MTIANKINSSQNRKLRRGRSRPTLATSRGKDVDRPEADGDTVVPLRQPGATHQPPAAAPSPAVSPVAVAPMAAAPAAVSPVMAARAAIDVPAEPPTPELLEYWRAVMLRKWAILALAILVGAIAYFIVSQSPPIYRSTVSVLIEPTHTKMVSSIEDVYSGVTPGREHLVTQAEVMKSREVATRVVKKLKLAENPDFDPRQARPPLWGKLIEEYVPFAAELVPGPPQMDGSKAESEALRALVDRLQVEPVRQSNVVRVSIESADPALAAQIVNAVAEAYIQADMDSRLHMTQNAGKWINERTMELRARLEASEKQLQAYREKEGLLDSRNTASGSGRQYDDLTQRLVDARVRRSDAEEALNQVKAAEASNYESVPAVVRSGSVQRAREIEADAEKRLAEVTQRYGPDHPKYVAAESELSTARANTRKSIQTILASVNREYNAARATERAIEEQLAQSRSNIQNLNRKEIQLGVLEREVTSNRQIFQTFLSRYKETTATSDAQSANARVIDFAYPPVRPIKPRKLHTTGLATAFGLVLGILFTLVHKRLDNTFKRIEDIDNLLRQPLLAALPEVKTNHKSVARVVLELPSSPYAEGIRTASTGLALSSLDLQRKVIVVTSSVPGEGKSTFSMALALSESRSKRVLLIEADLRRPTIGEVIGVPPEQKGLADLIAGNATPIDALLKINDTELHVLIAGRPTPSPLELIASRSFQDALANLSQSYDLVVIDSPPVQLVSDALVLGKQATGLIYVIRSDSTPIPLAKAGIRKVAGAGIHIFGVILNGHDFERAERYHGEYSGHGRYGYEKTYGSPAT